MDDNSVDILVVGGGAAGLMAASAAAGFLSSRGGGKVLVLEKMPRPGRKIMITGKGRCNFTNVKPWNDFSLHVHPKPDFLKPSFYNLPPEKVMEYFSISGMEPVVERGDRAFPASGNAADVVDALLRAAQDAGAQVICGKEVASCRRIPEVDGKSCGFEVICKDSQVYRASKLIICTGGLSYPSTGSTGDGYRWAESLGHTVTELFPSLTAVVPKGYKTNPSVGTMKGHIHRNEPLSEMGKLLCGNSLKNVGLTLSIDGNPVLNEFGDLDFTDGGIEGPLGFRASRRCVNAIIHGSRVEVSIDLKPAVSAEALSSRIATLFDEISKDRRSAGKPYRDRFRVLLGKVLPSTLIPAFTRSCPGLDHKSLPKVLKDWKMEICGFVGYERCVVTAGGVSRDEIVPKTLASRLADGLYFAGEILDLDADTGGFNLQIAFATGCLAGLSAARSIVR